MTDLGSIDLFFCFTTPVLLQVGVRLCYDRMTFTPGWSEACTVLNMFYSPHQCECPCASFGLGDVHLAW